MSTPMHTHSFTASRPENTQMTKEANTPASTMFEEHFRSAGSISLFVGLACNLAFVGQVYFWPAMWHTSLK